MFKQGSLFKPPEWTVEVKPRDPNVSEAARPRLSRQCLAILERLKQGPATNLELAGLGILKYTGRISDLRAAGCVILIDAQDHRTGRTLYRLESYPEGLGGS